ncbi:MAG TPA: hypothetical protein VG276_31535 [Actinomycetes bacterium]|nr:hypothetical protein [Actinomycetes bacterium]
MHDAPTPVVDASVVVDDDRERSVLPTRRHPSKEFAPAHQPRVRAHRRVGGILQAGS